jgi:hypothetical protein
MDLCAPEKPWIAAVCCQHLTAPSLLPPADRLIACRDNVSIGCSPARPADR